MERKDFLSKAWTLLIGKGLEAVESHPIVTGLEALADKKKRERPPGASKDDLSFQKLCTGCDACMIACPVNVIMIEDMERRLPVIFPEESPCIQCEDKPCIQACPTEALSLAVAK